MRIMFVCHGNICRSPMAEYIMKHLLYEEGIEDVFVASSATSTEEIWRGIGNPPYPPALAELKRRGIPTYPRRAVQLRSTDYTDYDLLVAMDECNLSGIRRIIGMDPEGKVHKLLSFIGSARDVADPWYSDRFDVAYDDIYAGCAALVDMIKSGKL